MRGQREQEAIRRALDVDAGQQRRVERTGIGQVKPHGIEQRHPHAAAHRFERPVRFGRSSVEVPQLHPVEEAIKLRLGILPQGKIGAHFMRTRHGAVTGVGARIIAAPDGEVANREFIVVEQRPLLA